MKKKLIILILIITTPSYANPTYLSISAVTHNLAKHLGGVQYLDTICNNYTDEWRDLLASVVVSSDQMYNARKILFKDYSNSYKKQKKKFSTCTIEAENTMNYYKSEIRSTINLFFYYNNKSR